eukprot:gene32791-33857_t
MTWISVLQSPVTRNLLRHLRLPVARSTGFSTHGPNAPPVPRPLVRNFPLSLAPFRLVLDSLYLATTDCQTLLVATTDSTYGYCSFYALASLSADNSILKGTSIDFKSELDAFAFHRFSSPVQMDCQNEKYITFDPRWSTGRLTNRFPKVFDDHTMGPDLKLVPIEDSDVFDTLSDSDLNISHKGIHPLDSGLIHEGKDQVDAQSKVSDPTQDPIIHEGNDEVDAQSKVSDPTIDPKVSAPPVPSTAHVATRTQPHLSDFGDADLFLMVSAPPVPRTDVATRTHPYPSDFSNADLFFKAQVSDPPVPSTAHVATRTHPSPSDFSDADLFFKGVSAPTVPIADVAGRTHPYLSVFSEEDSFYGNPSDDPKEAAEAIMEAYKIHPRMSPDASRANSIDVAMYDLASYGL